MKLRDIREGHAPLTLDDFTVRYMTDEAGSFGLAVDDSDEAAAAPVETICIQSKHPRWDERYHTIHEVLTLMHVARMNYHRKVSGPEVDWLDERIISSQMPDGAWLILVPAQGDIPSLVSVKETLRRFIEKVEQHRISR